MIYEAMIEGWVIPASLMIAAVLAIRFLLRGKISLRLQYALWAVVLVRLLIPFLLFVSPISADSVTEKLEIPETIHQVYFSANEEEYERQYAASYHETVRFYESKGKPLDTVVAEQRAAAVARQSIELNLQWKLFNLWLGGMAVMTAVIVACNVHLARQLRKRRYTLDMPACLLPVYVTAAVPTPCVFGFFRPAIYLTPEAAADGPVRRHVLEHELTHYRHGDHIWSVLRSVCLVLHWYNPLVWIAAKVSRADAELACDEGALARLGEDQRGDYGRTLIGLTCSAPVSDLILTATTMTGSAGSIRERIRLLMKRPRNTVLTITAVILMVTLIVGCTFSTAPATTPATEPTETATPGVDNDMSYQDQELPIPDDLTDTTTPTEPVDQTAEVAALFGEGGDPWYLAALTTPYAVDWWDFDPVAFFSAGQTAVALTKEEQALVTEVYGKEALELTIFRMHYGRLEQVLDTYIGTDLGVLNLTPFLFCPETESYLLVRETVPALRRPEILTCQQLDENEVCMVYRFPGEEQTYCATLRKSETWKIRSNQLLLAPPPDARALTAGELEQVRNAFAPDTAPLSCFVLGSYADISEMSQARFLSYYPTEEYGGATEEEFRLLKQKYPADFENEQTLRDMNWPITPVRAEEVRAIIEKYTLVDWDDLPHGDFLHYLEETDSYYVYYSDAGLFGFHCTAGWVYEGGAMLFGQEHMLILTERNGTYYIQAHLPAIVLGPPSSHPMIPAPETEVSDPRDDDVTALVTAFNRAYQENLYMGTDNPYDHLTVLALDPEITVICEGKTVPLSEFHKNIQFLHDKETWFKHTRSYGDETLEEYAISCQVSNIQYDGDTATVVTSGGITFADDDPAAPRGEGALHKFLLVNVNGIWLVADVLADGDGFDLMYKDNPTFDVEKMLAQRLPG